MSSETSRGRGPHFVLAGNGAYANRGCEAIAKSSVQLIRGAWPDATFTMATEVGDEDQPNETEPDVRHALLPIGWSESSPNEGTVRRFVHRLANAGELRWRNRTGLMPSPRTLRRIFESFGPITAVLSAGGDTYSLVHGLRFYNQVAMGNAVLQLGVPLVVWPATLGPFAQGLSLRALRRHFTRCALVLCREEGSVGRLKDMGVTRNVKLVADPAFLLKPAPPSIPVPENLAECIGVNLAPLTRYRLHLTLEAWTHLAAEIVTAIERKTGRCVVLVPHEAASRYSADEGAFLAQVAEVCEGLGARPTPLPSSLRAWELKWVIGKLAAFMAVKTHATVASFGSGVPTVTMFRGPKSFYIPRMMFGHDRFVLRPEQISPEPAAQAMADLLAESDQIREVLAVRIPEIRAMAHETVEHLRAAIGHR